MADTFTSNIQLQQPAVNSDNGIWGGFINTDLQAIDDAIQGIIAINIGGLSSFTLSATQGQSGANYQARFGKLTFTGALTGVCTVTIPGTQAYRGFAENQTTGGHAVVLSQNATGSTISLPVGTGTWNWFTADGTNVTQQSLGLGGVTIPGTFAAGGLNVSGGVNVGGTASFTAAGTPFAVTNSGTFGGNLTVAGTLTAGSVNATGTVTSLNAQTVTVTGTGTALMVNNSGTFGGEVYCGTFSNSGTSTSAVISNSGTATFGTNVAVNNNLTCGTSSCSGTATAATHVTTGTATFGTNVFVNNNLTCGTFSASGTATAATLSVTGTSTFNGSATFGSSIDVTNTAGTSTLLTDVLLGNTANAGNITLNGTQTAQQPQITIQNNGNNRWQLITTGTEAGSNAGSNLVLQQYADAGTSTATNFLTFTRSTGAAAFAGALNVSGAGSFAGNLICGTMTCTGTATAAAVNITGASTIAGLTVTGEVACGTMSCSGTSTAAVRSTTGTATFGSTVNIAGALTLQGSNVGGLIGVQVFSAGTSTYNSSAGTNYVIVACVGAGGGGGGCGTNPASQCSAGGGGGAGAWALVQITSSFSGGKTVIVGSGGSGGPANGTSSGATGGLSSFNGTAGVSCPGGPGGSNGGSTSGSAGVNSGGGPTGAITFGASVANIMQGSPGGIGDIGMVFPSINVAFGGRGASNPYGAGGEYGFATGAGVAGHGVGAGGGGAQSLASGAAEAGGAGANGTVVVYEYR